MIEKSLLIFGFYKSTKMKSSLPSLQLYLQLGKTVCAISSLMQNTPVFES